MTQNGLTNCIGNLIKISKSDSQDLSLRAKLTLYEVLRKVGHSQHARSLADHIRMTLEKASESDQSISDKWKTELFKLDINDGINLFYLGMYEEAVAYCKRALNHHKESKVSDMFPVVTLLSACYTQQSKFADAHDVFKKYLDLLPECTTKGHHTKHGVFLLNLSSLKLNIHEYENAKELAQQAFKIFAKNLGYYHYLSGLALLQEALLTMAVTSTTEGNTHTQNSLDAVKDIFSKLDLQHHLGIKSLVEKLESTEQLQSEELMTLSCFQLVDYPFSWIDFHPSKHFVIFGADSQVWEHLEQLKIQFPFKYQWFKGWMGEFHKLSNLHQRVGKRFLKFHLEKHAAAYLDDPTPAKLQKFIKFDDFISSNDFFLTDVLAGISELLLVCSKVTSKESDTITFTDLHSFCESYEDHHPEMKLIKQYLLRYGTCLIGLLEAQKFGNYDLNLAMTKMLCPLNFTTRATHYAPDTVGHIHNMEILSASEKEIGRFLFTLFFQ